MTQTLTFMENWTFPVSRTWNTKRWPPSYDVMIWWRSPRHAPHSWGRRRRCVFDLPYACIGEKSDGRTLFSFVLNPKVRWSLGNSRAHRLHAGGTRSQRGRCARTTGHVCARTNPVRPSPAEWLLSKKGSNLRSSNLFMAWNYPWCYFKTVCDY